MNTFLLMFRIHHVMCGSDLCRDLAAKLTICGRFTGRCRPPLS